MTTISRQTFTIFPTEAQAQHLALQLLADDPETDYRVVENFRGFFVAIFENNVQTFTL